MLFRAALRSPRPQAPLLPLRTRPLSSGRLMYPVMVFFIRDEKIPGWTGGGALAFRRERWATTPICVIAFAFALACARVVAWTNIGGILCRRISPHDTSFPSPLNWMWNDISHDLVPVVSAASECRSLSLASPATGSRVRTGSKRSLSLTHNSPLGGLLGNPQSTSS